MLDKKLDKETGITILNIFIFSTGITALSTTIQITLIHVELYRDSLDVNLITIETANARSLIVRLLKEDKTIPQARRHGTRLALTRSLGGDLRFAIANYFLILTHQLSIRTRDSIPPPPKLDSLETIA